MGLMYSIKVDNNYAIVSDNWYSQEEYNQVLKECKFLVEYGKSPEKSGSASDEDGTLLKNNKATFIGEIFRDFNISYIGRHSFKQYDDQFVKKCIDIDPIYYMLYDTNKHDCLMSYYEDSDYYKAHHDVALFSLITWLYEEPKAFTGGNLSLKSRNGDVVQEIECIPNRSVLFPSYMMHEVSEISMEEKDMNQNKGRFTISQFSIIT
jgi:Rps23 Pro-64 3,4-dihydroxylase Tpa1-like proline 4-hydroxylase